MVGSSRAARATIRSARDPAQLRRPSRRFPAKVCWRPRSCFVGGLLALLVLLLLLTLPRRILSGRAHGVSSRDRRRRGRRRAARGIPSPGARSGVLVVGATERRAVLRAREPLRLRALVRRAAPGSAARPRRLRRRVRARRPRRPGLRALPPRPSARVRRVDRAPCPLPRRVPAGGERGRRRARGRRSGGVVDACLALRGSCSSIC